MGLLHTSNGIFLSLQKNVYFEQQKKKFECFKNQEGYVGGGCCLPTPWAEQGEMGLNFSKTGLN